MTEASRLLAQGKPPSVEAIAAAAGVSRTTFYRTFGSRAHLLAALNLEPEPGPRERGLEVALGLLQTRSLADLSMDELASRSAISRANLYRLFPGKTALFRAILVAYSPFQPVMALLARAGDRPPEQVIPELVRTAYRAVSARAGLVRTIVFEITSMTPETQAAFRETGLLAFATLGQYLARQMAAGRLRRVHPLLAVQALVGPVMLHALGSGLLTRASPEAPSGEGAVDQLAAIWLRAMRPEA